jgi:hypothetical protein
MYEKLPNTSMWGGKDRLGTENIQEDRRAFDPSDEELPGYFDVTFAW